MVRGIFDRLKSADGIFIGRVVQKEFLTTTVPPLLGLTFSISNSLWANSWLFKLLSMMLLAGLVVWFVARVDWPGGRKSKYPLCALGFCAIVAMGYVPVVEQYHTEAVLRDYRSTRELLAKYQSHDETIKSIVAQYDRLSDAASLFSQMTGNRDSSTQTIIQSRTVDDLKAVLNNYEAVAVPMGQGLRIKLGQNMYRVIFPAPMRVEPQLRIDVPVRGVTAQIVEQSNIGFTILFLPLHVPVSDFQITASAEL